ncbi:sodium- and chloride-dependent GABA transporter 3-like [Haliotis rufescens]|uniref:sodium- and chloride-dependent GABA transporter 3-like n=1 Tax=Haliotis rufescens TaxID=6454 RepID=UPI00201EEA8D|nr:sodium- and chloride-dependent GABA transporter 3-like [Haliotis rufescens]
MSGPSSSGKQDISGAPAQPQDVNYERHILLQVVLTPALGIPSYLTVYGTLRVSSGINNFGSVQVHLLLCNLASWVVVFLCLMKGIRSVGKVVYVTVLVPYILLTMLLIRSCMMPGSGEGILYFLRPDFSRLASVQVWLEALLQGFYSTSVTYGALITMSSYNNFYNRPLKDVVLVTVIGEVSSILCGLVVFSTLGFMAHQAQIPISEVVSSGSGLGFIIYPEAIAQLPVSQLWAVLFFIMLFMMGIDSMGGIYLFQLMEWYASSFSTLLIGCLECVVINWIYGKTMWHNLR